MPGEKWEGRIDENLQRADLVLLPSRDFIALEYCHMAMEIALLRETTGQAHIVPIILRPCGWQFLRVRANHALPTDGAPVARSGPKPGHHNVAWLEIEEGIRRVLAALARRPGP